MEVVKKAWTYRDTSTNEDRLKKQCEGSLIDLKNLYGIFKEKLSSPDCGAILVNSIKNVEKLILEIFIKTEEAQSS